MGGPPNCHLCGVEKTLENTYHLDNTWAGYCRKCRYKKDKERLKKSLGNQIKRQKTIACKHGLNIANAEELLREKSKDHLTIARTARIMKRPELYMDFLQDMR